MEPETRVPGLLQNRAHILMNLLGLLLRQALFDSRDTELRPTAGLSYSITFVDPASPLTSRRSLNGWVHRLFGSHSRQGFVWDSVFFAIVQHSGTKPIAARNKLSNIHLDARLEFTMSLGVAVVSVPTETKSDFIQNLGQHVHRLMYRHRRRSSVTRGKGCQDFVCDTDQSTERWRLSHHRKPRSSEPYGAVYC